MSEQFEVLQTVTARLDQAEIPYMISGSMAMNYYAQPRMTRDIDIVLALVSSDADRLEELFAEDFYLDRESIQRAIMTDGMFNLIHFDYVAKVDFIVRKNSEYRRLEFSRRRRVEIEGQFLYMVSPEDLLLSKLEWGRETESELQFRDIRNLIDSVIDLDWAYIQQWANSLGLRSLLERVRS
ncbi:MAG: nucleotidyl transferase AbiEii/AbiGii toxin family protein [Acidobacteriota bacterium]